MKNRENYKKIIAHFGEEKQIIKFLEELGELQAATCRVDLGEIKLTDTAFLEELADVEIMCKQMEIILGIDIELMTIIDPDHRNLLTACIYCSSGAIYENDTRIDGGLIYIKSLIHSFKNHHGIVEQVNSIKEKKMQRVLRRIEKEKTDV